MLTLGMMRWTLWNLLLAAVPVILAIALAIQARHARSKPKRWPFVAILALAWLAFLPNSCYLLTEWRHFLFNPNFQMARDLNNALEFSVYRVLRHVAFYAAYSGFGMMCFVLSVRWVEQGGRLLGLNTGRIALPLFFLVSLGVYLGLGGSAEFVGPRVAARSCDLGCPEFARTTSAFGNGLGLRGLALGGVSRV